MIKNIKFKNYKAYDSGEIEFKPITILLGANSSGKSSILQLLLLLEQSLNISTGYESALKLNGKFIKLGEAENIFKNKNTKKDIVFSVDVDITKMFFLTEFRRIKRSLENDIGDLYIEILRLSELLKLEVKDEKNNFRKKQIFDELEIEDIENFVEFYKKRKRKINVFFKDNPQFRNDYYEQYLKIFNYEAIEIIETYNLVNGFYNLSPRSFRIEYSIGYSDSKNNLFINSLSIFIEDVKYLGFGFENKKGHKRFVLESCFVSPSFIDKYRVKFAKNVVFQALSIVSVIEFSNSEIRRNKKYEIDNELFCSTILRLFLTFTNSLQTAFNSNRINYISPLRAFPKRYYFLDESNISSSLDSIDGDNLAEIIKKETAVKQKVNRWLNNFGLSVSVEDIQDIIHKLKINQNGLNLDITDVGFGISQILPIIVQGFMSKPNSFTIIEQPEIHLHPMMQAELADLFIDVITSEDLKLNKTLLIETHSESILKRLRRRISEGKIKSTDVAIYFIHPRTSKTSTAVIDKIEIGPKGAFDWPSSFYSTDLEDTSAFLRNQ